MTERVKLICKIAVGLILCVLTTAVILQAAKIAEIKKDAENEKEAAILARETVYKDVIIKSILRQNKLENYIDSLQDRKQIRREAIKINTQKSDAKVNYINNAGDSLLLWISDSTLRYNGQR